MNQHPKPTLATAIAVLTASLLACAGPAAGGKPAPRLEPLHVVLLPAPVNQELLRGVPQTGGMRSGRVVLSPGKAMHRHTTGENEELLVFLAGRASVILGSTPIAVAAGEVLYIPPRTEHEVVNDGQEEARYVYTVAPVR